MKNLILKLVILFLPLVLSSCNSSKKKEMTDLNIDIVLKGKISEITESPMAQKIITFIKPIECVENAYVTHVTLRRTDLPNENPFKIEVSKSLLNKWLREPLHIYDYGDLQNDYAEYLPKIEWGDYLSKDSTDTSSIFSYSSNDLIFYLTNADSSNEKNHFNNADKIVSAITDLLCNNKFDNSKKIIVVILQDGQIIEKISGSNGLVTSKISQKVGDPPPPPPPPPPTSIEQLQKVVDTIPQINDDTVLEQKIRSVIEMNPLNDTLNYDYMYYYLLAKIAVVGTSPEFHPRAFDYLKKAARIAISSNKSLDLLEKISRDSDDEYQTKSNVRRRMTWRLIHGEHEEWHRIERALRNNNLSEISSSHGHH